MVNLYFSYSNKDRALRDEMEVRLSELKGRGVIDEWFDSRASEAGLNNEVTNLYFETADIILLLVRPYFVASEARYNYEMERAMRKHENGEARVIPVILDPAGCQNSITDEPALELFRDNSGYDIFLEITDAVQRAAEEIRNSSIPELKLASEG
ncbi:MAG TPA: TIR domain-containing protein [Ignavibacteriales bacterium]|nr:TIR domain-containing protein [Ignavibacteriales bacterium]